MNEKEMKDIIKVVLLAVFFLAMIVAGPFVTIWSLNTIFTLMIPYNTATWFAMLWIGIIINGGFGATFKK